QPVDVGQAVVQQDEVKLILMKLSQPAFSVLGRLHSESVLSQKAFQNSGKRLIVFDQEDFRHNQSGPVANGTLKNKKESRNILPDFLLTAKKQVGTPPRLPLPEKKRKSGLVPTFFFTGNKRPNYYSNYSTF